MTAKKQHRTASNGSVRYQNTNIQPGFKARLTFLELAGINLQRCSHRGGEG